MRLPSPWKLPSSISGSNSKNNDVPTDFCLFLDKVASSTESKMHMSLECVEYNESVDTFSIFLLSEEQSENIKFYQWEWNEDSHTENTLNYGDYGEVFDMLIAQLQGFLIHTYVKRLLQVYFESLRDNVNGQEILIQINFSENFSLIGRIISVQYSLCIYGSTKM